MSVLACCRNGCDNVMCDRLSHEHGYICNDCFDELVASGSLTDIDDFMNDPPKKQDTFLHDYWVDYVNNEFEMK